MLRKIALILAGTALMNQAYAHHVAKSVDVADLTERSKLVFHGEVVDIAYRGSQATKYQRSLPHTFVTYQIHEVLHGNMKRKTYTLRFQGGATEQGNAMLSTATPQFSVGDEDILFVSDNGMSECPLVDCADGRFRVVDGQAFNALGQKMLMDEKGAIVAGGVEEHDLLNSFVLDDKVISMRKGYKHTEEKDARTTIKSPGQTARKHLDTNAFVNALLDKIDLADLDDPRGLGKKVKYVDKDEPFSVIAAKPVSLTDPVVPETPVSKNANDRFEIEAAKAQNGNPVLD